MYNEHYTPRSSNGERLYMTEKNNRVAVISGGATFIGECIAKEFINSGLNVVIADINADDGHDIAKRLDPQTVFIPTDITNDEDIENCIDETLRQFGRIDYFVSMACTYLDKGLESSRNDWTTAMDINVISGGVFAQKVAEKMQSESTGAIVFFSSTSAKVAQADCLLYAVAKAAILGMTRNLALLLSSDGIRVNCVLPGWTWSTPIMEATGSDRLKADKIAKPYHLAGRVIDAEEVARTVNFLCSNAASGITGTEIPVDGGYLSLGPEAKTNNESKLAD